MLDYETQCKVALCGGAFDWKQTPIEITATARATDPLRGLRGEWWKNAEPRYADGKQVIVITEPQTRDGKVEENRMIHHSNEPAAEQRDELEPEDSETIGAWLGRVATLSGTENPFWKALYGYTQRFRPDASARRTLDRKVVSSFLKSMRGTARRKQ